MNLIISNCAGLKDFPQTSPAEDDAILLLAAIGFAFEVSDVPGIAKPPGPGY